METSRLDFLYLSEPDMIKAGVMDMEKCVDEMCEVYRVMGQGDYIMGGRNGNSHGQPIFFPDNPTCPGMPKNGPDRRFMTMEAYLGGKYRVCGEKWYGSNRENMTKGLPRSILMVMLNDADTGAPLALMSGNMLSNMRTGAIPGVGARYLAKKDSRVCGLVGAGVITRLSFTSLVQSLPCLEEVKIYDIIPAASERLAGFIRENYPQIKSIRIVDTLEQAICDSDVVHIATSGKDTPIIQSDWIKAGAYVSLPANIRLDRDFAAKHCMKVVDNWLTYEAWTDELTYPYSANIALLGCMLLDMVHDQELDVDDIISLGDIVTGKKPCRTSDEEIVLFGQFGLPTYDVAWGWHCLQNAKKQGLGQSLNLWETPMGV
ncbi:ornithine cyclodeaminase [Pseudoflavonifractor sp. 60]|uniref:tyramine oxidase subunit B n=1 Tax=Pseudoflavonifractor sp. 60 TaxID=2304576 RepID=UPI0013689B01|nr:tyramine oxidase subunit B [Pseudoflavonifractor sp. 60]NBI67915.1 ornithine cyclodeaminase [Pseudoflavonifractor sp. 60]